MTPSDDDTATEIAIATPLTRARELAAKRARDLVEVTKPGAQLDRCTRRLPEPVNRATTYCDD